MRYLRQLLPRRRDLPSVGAAARRWGSMRWAALPITDRRWTAPLAAAALGMGLFVGVAIGPRAEQSTGAPAQFVAVPPEFPAPPPAAAPPPATPSPTLGGPVGNNPPPAPAIPSPNPIPPVETAPLTPPTPLPPITADGGATTPLPPAEEGASEQAPSDASAEEVELVLAGTVVHVNPLARSYTLAGRGGRLSAIHAKRLPSAGARLKLPVRELRNGTFAAAAKARKSGTRKQAVLSGVVTFSDPGASRFTLSQRGVSALVTVPAESGAPEIPKLGAQVDVEARIAPAPAAPPPPAQTPPPVPEPPTTTTTTPAPAPGPVEAPAGRAAPGVPPGCGIAPAQPKAPSSILEAKTIEITGESVAEGDFEGVVQGVCRERRRLILSADDLRASEADLTFAVPSKAISLRRLRPGDVVSAVAAINRSNGRLKLAGIARDRGIGEADDPKLAQGAGGTGSLGGPSAGDGDVAGGSTQGAPAERTGSPRR